MDFAFTEEQLAIKDSVGKLCAGFDGKYWLKKDKEGGFPEDFYRAMADAGWLGIAMPEAYGGAGLGITEASIMMQAVAESGAALQGASAIQNFDYLDRLSTIKAPTLVICGDQDEGTPPERNKLIASKIPGGRYEGIANARHLPNVERPEQFNRIMMSFLAANR